MKRVLFGMLGLLFALAPAARGAVSVQVVRVDEQRVKELGPDASQAAQTGQVTLTLRLGGAELAGATEYGRLRITEATDDTGASIKPEQAAFSGDLFLPLGSAFGVADAQAAPKPPEIQVSLAAPSRSATSVARVKGDVQVKAGGRAAVVKVADIAPRVGKRVDDPALKAARLTVTIVDPRTARPEDGVPPDAATGNTVTVKIVGDNSVVKRIEVVGADGQSVSPGRSSSGSGDTMVHTLILERPLEASMALKIDVLSGQKLVRVPLDLKSVPLP
jgi:hypothetical protein